MASEIVELRGHIIDSLILPKVLDEILRGGGTFKIDEVRIGQKRVDQSFARIEVSAPDGETLDGLVLRLRQHGAEITAKIDVRLAIAPADGVFPPGFYVTTNQPTFVRLGGKEIEVAPALMDSGVRVRRDHGTASAVRFEEIQKGDEFVVGHQGIRVAPIPRATSHTDVFQFINTSVSAEKPKSGVIRELAREFQKVRATEGKILVVAGPAVVHAGAGQHLEALIDGGFVQRLFAGNGLAVYDVESALYRTALGVDLERGTAMEGGHENHMRAINFLREAGGVAAAVEQQKLTRGILHACIRREVDIVLSGSIRDDGPIPGVTTDAIAAQRIMREKLEGVSLILMLGSMLHSIAVANLVSAAVKIVVVDIDASAVAKITDRQSFQSVGLVTDVELFLRELVTALGLKTPVETTR